MKSRLRQIVIILCQRLLYVSEVIVSIVILV